MRLVAQDDKVFQARLADKVLYVFIAEAISLAHHLANQDPPTVGTKTMSLFMDSLKDCMTHLICHPACLLRDNVEHTRLDWLNKLLNVMRLDRACSGRPDASDGFPTGFRRRYLKRS